MLQLWLSDTRPHIRHDEPWLQVLILPLEDYTTLLRKVSLHRFEHAGEIVNFAGQPKVITFMTAHI